MGLRLGARWLVLGGAIAACGGVSSTGVGVEHPDAASSAEGDAGTSTPVGEACTATLTGSLVVTFGCVVSHTSSGGDLLLFAVDPRVPVKGMASFYETLQAKTAFAPGTYAAADFASAAATLTTTDGTKWSSSSARLTLHAIGPATATATYDTADQGSLDSTLASPAGATASLHIDF
jgi:hypothetical protein